MIFTVLFAAVGYVLHLYHDGLIGWAISGLLSIAAAVNIGGALTNIRETVRSFGREHRDNYRKLYKLLHTTDSSASYINFVAEVLGIGTLLLAFVFHLHIVPLGIWLLSVYFFNASQLVRLPLVLLLGSSSDSKLRLEAALAAAVQPHRVTSLMKFSKTGGAQARLRSMRGHDDVTWEERVRQLLEFSQLIVIDARDSTDAVIAESNRSCQAHSCSKLLS